MLHPAVYCTHIIYIYILMYIYIYIQYIPIHSHYSTNFASLPILRRHKELNPIHPTHHVQPFVFTHFIIFLMGQHHHFSALDIPFQGSFGRSATMAFLKPGAAVGGAVLAPSAAGVIAWKTIGKMDTWLVVWNMNGL